MEVLGSWLNFAGNQVLHIDLQSCALLENLLKTAPPPGLEKGARKTFWFEPFGGIYSSRGKPKLRLHIKQPAAYQWPHPCLSRLSPRAPAQTFPHSRSEEDRDYQSLWTNKETEAQRGEHTEAQSRVGQA